MATGSGTGTAATSPTATTAAVLITTVRAILGDETADVWPDAELLGYLNEGVLEYSQHLRRISTTTVAAVASERRYALPTDLVHVLGVEYPGGGTPPSYIYRLGYTNRRFNGRLYDVLPGNATIPPRLVLAFDPDDGATFIVTYSHPHAAADALTSAVTVPTEHHHVLLHYILYAAARRLTQREQITPTSSSSLLMSQLAANTRRLELTYLNALNRILTGGAGEGAVVTWGAINN